MPRAHPDPAGSFLWLWVVQSFLAAAVLGSLFLWVAKGSELMLWLSGPAFSSKVSFLQKPLSILLPDKIIAMSCSVIAQLFSQSVGAQLHPSSSACASDRPCGFPELPVAMTVLNVSHMGEVLEGLRFTSLSPLSPNATFSLLPGTSTGITLCFYLEAGFFSRLITKKK